MLEKKRDMRRLSSALTVGLAEADITAEIAELKAELLSINRAIEMAKPKLSELQQQISLIEQQRENVKITRAVIVWNEELQTAKQNFAETQLQIEESEEQIKGLSTRSRTYSDKKKTADTSYRNSFSALLDATNINTEGIDLQSLNLYNSVNLSGTADTSGRRSSAERKRTSGRNEKSLQTVVQ